MTTSLTTPDPCGPPVPPVPEPDDKDWTWVLARPCSECGFDASAAARDELAPLIGTLAARWEEVLAGPADALRRRPRPQVWSPAEYGCHVRDVLVRFRGRTTLMLDQDDPEFENWDQDATALSERYWEQGSARVAGELSAAAAALIGVLEALDDDGWARTGRRSNGSVFTVDSLVRYMLHDLAHHLHDVGAG